MRIMIVLIKHDIKNSLMQSQLQNGIYHLGPKIGNSCHITFLKVGEGSNASEIGEVLIELQGMFQNLEKGIVQDLKDINQRHLHPGNLTTLVGYGPQMFSIKGVRKQMPQEFNDQNLFKRPNLSGGGPICQGTDIPYADDIVKNEVASDHIVLQFIGDNEFTTNRATFETWKLLSKFQNGEGNQTLYISSVFTGFQRDDKRNWFGFHDGVSNLPSKDRLQVIGITRDDVYENDAWIINGTYMAFLRIEFNISNWSNINGNDQSIIIGRDKITGCPLIGVDKNNQPIKDSRCPVRGTFEVLEKGNEIFREHPPFGKQVYLPRGISDKALTKSHIGIANPAIEQSVRNNQYRIFRQGFEFLQPTQTYPGFRVGLNFISFQKSPKRLFNILKNSSDNKINFDNGLELPSFDSFFSVRAAGVFLVPPLVKSQPFPGAAIFLDDRSLRNVSKSGYSYK